MSEQRGDPPVTEKAPHSYIIVGYDGENYRPLIVGVIGTQIHFDAAALMGLCGIEGSSIGQLEMEVPVKTVPDDDFQKLRKLLASIPTPKEVQP